MKGRRQLAAAFLSTTLLAAAVAGDESVCGLYLAVSSTSTVEDTNWGIYTGKDIAEGSPIGSPDIGINIMHLRANSVSKTTSPPPAAVPPEDIVEFFERFFWVPETAAAQFEQGEGERSVAAIPGAGVLASYLPKLTNADWNLRAMYFRPPILDQKGVNHPNRGAISPLTNIEVMATTDISAGSEIFMEFGESWAEDADENELTKEDYSRIDETVEQMIAFFDKHKDSLDENGKHEIYSFLIKDVMKAAVGTAKSRRVATLLPPNPDDLHKVPEAGGSLRFSDPTSYRSQDWLETYGLCMDNIEPGVSTIKNAGLGAFAARPIKKGGLVAPVPLTHVSNKDVLDMHKLEENVSGDFVRASNEVVSQQLIMNYCYGHPESSMVFFPSGAVVNLVNHSNKPNAKLVWSSHPNHQKLWLEKKPSELMEEENLYIGLVMEIVALQDIKPGEEIFIDYGKEWKDAYDKYVKDWERKVKSKEVAKDWPIRAVDMNYAYHKKKPFETPEELEKAPYPDNVVLKAFLLLQPSDKAGTKEDPKEWGEDENEKAIDHDNLFDIVVIGREKVADSDAVVPYTYLVQWSNDSGIASYVTGVPHEALTFVDASQSGDQFVEAPFRHYIGIPDEIFPQGAWRNLA